MSAPLHSCKLKAAGRPHTGPGRPRREAWGFPGAGRRRVRSGRGRYRPCFRRSSWRWHLEVPAKWDRLPILDRYNCGKEIGAGPGRGPGGADRSAPRPGPGAAGRADPSGRFGPNQG